MPKALLALEAIRNDRRLTDQRGGTTIQPLLANPRQNLTEATVLAAINSPNPRVTFGVDVLDPTTLAETGESLPLNLDAGGSVSWAYRPTSPGAGATQTVQVRRSAQVTVDGNIDDGFLLGRLFRLWTEMTAPDGTQVRFHLGTFLSALPGKADDGKVVSRTLTLTPREHLWASRKLDDYQVVLGTTNVLNDIRSDLDGVFGILDTAFPEPEGASTLGEDMVFPTGTSYMEKWTRLLAGIAYDAPTTNVDGLPTSQSLATLAGKGAEWLYAPGEGRITVPGSIDPLDPDLPNVLRYEARGPSLGPIEGNGLYTVVNQSDGPASIDQRGFEVFRSISADASNQAELEAFGNADAQRVLAGGGLRLQVEVGFNPLHDDRDVVEIVRPRLGTSGVWLPTGWQHTVGRVNSPQSALTKLTAEYRVDVQEAA